MSTSDEHHRRAGRHGVEVLAIREALLFELSLVPVRIADDHILRPALLDARGDLAERLGERARLGEIDAGTAARTVQMAVLETGDDRFPADVQHRGLRPD